MISYRVPKQRSAFVCFANLLGFIFACISCRVQYFVQCSKWQQIAGGVERGTVKGAKLEARRTGTDGDRSFLESSN